MHMYVRTYVCRNTSSGCEEIDNACLHDQKATGVRNHAAPSRQVEHCEDCSLLGRFLT